MRVWKNSKYVLKGDAFLVDKQNEMYVKTAIKNGASMIITELDKTYEIDTIKVNSIKDYIKNNYDFSDIKLIGITGTNGKTTTCYLIYQMLNLMGIKTSYIGTIGFYINNEVIKLDNTTPSIDILYNLIDASKQEGCEVVVMEASSHALKQGRLYGLLFDAIAVTNVTKDHLDYHKTMKDYIESKMIITNMLKKDGVCILNKKDKYYKKFINHKNKCYIIGKDIKIKSVKTNLSNTVLMFKDGKNIRLELQLVGMFNVYNFLMAYKIVKELGYDSNIVVTKSINLKEPPGRMQKITFGSNIIFIDYAHTKDAVLNVLKTVNKIKNSGLITIIGCGGNRDKSKRPLMAKVACKYSDIVIFTNDNPRFEDEKEIISDMLNKAFGKYEVIYDRYKAIERGIHLLNDKNILMILGKGHEDYQIIGDEKLPFSDIKVTKEIVNKM